MIQLVYISKAVRPFADSELQDLVARARSKNVEANVTGVLVYCAGFFMQLIEGSSETIDQLYRKIEADGRHRAVKCLIKRSIADRSFPQWDMALINFDRAEELMPKKAAQLESLMASSTDSETLPFDMLLQFVTPVE